MDKIKCIVAENIVRLRQYKGLTQLELAEKLNYSDKSVSKWERGESLPDVPVMMQLAEIFGVSLDYLVHEHSDREEIPSDEIQYFKFKKRSLILGMSVMLVWLIATLVFVVLHLAVPQIGGEWLSFIWAVPISLIVWLVLNSVWFSQRRNYPIISLLMWMILSAAFITCFFAGHNVWLIFVLGIPGQFIILMWSRMGKKRQYA